MPIYEYRCTSCGTTETKIMSNATRESTEHKCVCGDKQEQFFTKAPRGVNNLMKKGPLETYKDGDHKCFYTNELLLSAQANL